MKPIEVFTSGTHTAMNGSTSDFSEADVEAIASAYNPQKHEAPLVVGHPKDNAPAYGWVKSLFFNEGSLHAIPQQVDPGFEEMVKAGRFKKRSASLYAPDSPNNPTPGQFYLRHVGFLGAQPPAIKGLKDIDFGSAEEGVINIELNFSEIEQKEMPPETVTKEAEFAAREKALADKEAKIRKREVADFAEGLIKDGKILPKQKEQLINILSAVPESQTVDFGENNQQPLSQSLQAFLKDLPKAIEYSEIAKGETVETPTDPVHIAQQAVAYAEQQAKNGITVSMTQAVAHITKGAKH